MSDLEHSPEEMQAAIKAMRQVASGFYYPAMRTGCHAFIEFCGFMNEYVEVCRTTMEAGEDFMLANEHSQQPLVMTRYQAKYLAEKFNCIFGPTLRANPEARAAFKEALGL